MSLRAVGVAIAVLVIPVRAVRADDRLLTDDTFAVHSTGDVALDGGLVVGVPSALPSGISTGVGVGITRTCGCYLAYGARLSWSQVSESSQFWDITQMDVKLRATGSLRHQAGRGTVALRLGVGPTFVREDRVRTQSMRERMTLESKAWGTLPAADLEAVVALGVTGGWQMMISAGPSVDYFQGSLHAGWTAELGVAWQP